MWCEIGVFYENHPAFASSSCLIDMFVCVCVHVFNIILMLYLIRFNHSLQEEVHDDACCIEPYSTNVLLLGLLDS